MLGMYDKQKKKKMRWKRKGRIITEKEKKPEVPSGKRAKGDELRGGMEKKCNG